VYCVKKRHLIAFNCTYNLHILFIVMCQSRCVTWLICWTNNSECQQNGVHNTSSPLSPLLCRIIFHVLLLVLSLADADYEWYSCGSFVCSQFINAECKPDSRSDIEASRRHAGKTVAADCSLRTWRSCCSVCPKTFFFYKMQVLFTDRCKLK